jgi:hypothetical protein
MVLELINSLVKYNQPENFCFILFFRAVLWFELRVLSFIRVCVASCMSDVCTPLQDKNNFNKLWYNRMYLCRREAFLIPNIPAPALQASAMNTHTHTHQFLMNQKHKWRNQYSNVFQEIVETEVLQNKGKYFWKH